MTDLVANFTLSPSSVNAPAAIAPPVLSAWAPSVNSKLDNVWKVDEAVLAPLYQVRSQESIHPLDHAMLASLYRVRSHEGVQPLETAFADLFAGPDTPARWQF